MSASGRRRGADMAHARNFKVALTRAIVPTGEPAAELTTLEDAARSVGLLQSWRQRYGIDAKLFDWSDEITATAPEAGAQLE